MSLRIDHSLATESASRSFFKKEFKPGRRVSLFPQKVEFLKGSNNSLKLVISEKMRAQVVGLLQPVRNSDSTISLLQTVENSLSEINFHLKSIRQLASHASMNVDNEGGVLDANQAEITNILDQIDQIAKTTHHGSKRLFGGNNGIESRATGRGLLVTSISEKTQPSPPGGYKIQLRQSALRASVKGTVPLTRELIDRNEELKIREGEREISFLTEAGESVTDFVRRVQKELKKRGFKLNISKDNLNRLCLRHHEFGSEHFFTVSSSTSGVLSQVGKTELLVQNGQDVEGAIDNGYAIGNGEFLTGGVGTPADGLTVKISTDLKQEQKTGLRREKIKKESLNLESGETALPTVQGIEVGTVEITANTLTFYSGDTNEKQIKILLPNTNSSNLGRLVENRSGFENLRELDIRTMQGTDDAVRLIDTAIKEISDLQNRLWRTERHTLESNIASLSVAKENISHVDSVLDDLVSVARTAKQTMGKILDQSGLTFMAQASQNSHHVLTLLG